MTRDDDLSLLIEGYLNDYQGSTPLPPRVRDAVVARLSTTTQHGTVRGTTFRLADAHGLVRAMVAIAAVVVVAVLGIDLLPARQAGQGASAPASDLGIFEPARGWVVFMAASRLEAVDPLDPSSSVAIEPVGLDLGADTMPAGWSADGSKLALTVEEGGVLYVMDAAGSLDRVAVEELSDAAFGCCSFTTSSWLSPDGTQGLAFARGDQGGLAPGKLYLLDLDDVGRSRAVEVEDFEWARGTFSQPPMPAWSPDGTRVAYVWSKDGDLATPAIGIVDLATETSRELTSGWGLVRQLVWSPDGSRLLVVAAEDGPGFGGALNPLTHPQPAGLHLVDIDDAETHEIATGHYVAAAWSPDGSQIAAVDYSGNRRVVVMDSDGTGDRRILAELPAGDLFTGVVWHPIPADSE